MPYSIYSIVTILSVDGSNTVFEGFAVVEKLACSIQTQMHTKGMVFKILPLLNLKKKNYLGAPKSQFPRGHNPETFFFFFLRNVFTKKNSLWKVLTVSAEMDIKNCLLKC